MNRDEVREWAASWGYDACVDDEREDGQGHVDVEECGDLLAACFVSVSGVKGGFEYERIPTAVNLDLT